MLKINKGAYHYNDIHGYDILNSEVMKMNIFANILGSGLNINSAYEKSKENGAVLLDVRSKSEFKQGHLPKAINVPVETMNGSKINQIKDLNKTIYVYCLSGARARNAAHKLKAAGYTDVTAVGGINSYHGPIQR